MLTRTALLAVTIGLLATGGNADAARPKAARTAKKSTSRTHKVRAHARVAKRPAPKAPKPEVTFTADEANNAALAPALTAKAAGSSVLRAQVLLDRAHFSPGEIDGSFGDSMSRAVDAFNTARGIAAGATVAPETWAELNRGAGPVVVSYTITPEDVAGPFEKIPEKMEDKAKLPAMSWESPEEALGERFHMSPKLFAKLNPGVAIQAGAPVLVLDVNRPPLPKAASITVSEGDLSISVLERNGHVMARYPATVGSEHDPLPVGQWKVNGVGWNPVFKYNPDLFWDADPSDGKALVKPGPNNPVGVVWMDLSKPHYGIHGTPEPSTIGKTASHGCIRLTNWDAVELAHLVGPGTPALLAK